MKTFFLCVLCVLCGSSSFAATAQPKIIEWGWDSPSCVWVKDHITEMEKLPFDGVVLELHANGKHDPTTRPHRQAAFPSRGWGSRVIDPADFSESIAALKATKFSRFTDNFLRFNTNPGNVDYFDDEGFKGVVANFRLLARIAKEAGMKGIMLDTEAYGNNVFNYSGQRAAKEHSYGAYCQQARKRGREMMSAACEAFPEIRVMVTLSYGLPHGLEGKEPMPQHKYGLLPSLLDGMIEGTEPKAMLIDGWEYAYNNRTKADYDASLDMLKNQSQAWSAVPELKKDRWHASFGIWLDYKHKWNAQDFEKNFFTPAEFAYAVHEALNHTDAYAWVWSEIPNWWNGTMPSAYIDALKEARKPDLQAPPPRGSPF